MQKFIATLVIISVLVLVALISIIVISECNYPAEFHTFKSELTQYEPYVDGYQRDAWILTFNNDVVIVARWYQINSGPQIGATYEVTYSHLNSDDDTRIKRVR